MLINWLIAKKVYLFLRIFILANGTCSATFFYFYALFNTFGMRFRDFQGLKYAKPRKVLPPKICTFKVYTLLSNKKVVYKKKYIKWPKINEGLRDDSIST